MGFVGRLRRQDHFRIRRDLNRFRSRAQVCNAHSAHFNVVFRRNHDFEGRNQGTVAPRELGVVVIESRRILVRF